MKKFESPKNGDIKILKVSVSSFSVELEKGDTVEIIGIGERGYDLKHVGSEEVVKECGWDLFL